MDPRRPQYALVAYIRNSLGHFVESMRQDLHPDHTHSPAHITILPPRPLCGSEDEAIQLLRDVLSSTEEFDVRLGEVETFYPTTPTVFIRVEHSAHRIRDLHDKLNTAPLSCRENWPFMPHLTIVKMPEMSQTQGALEASRTRWQHFKGSRETRIVDVTFVREAEQGQWTDLVTFSLKPRES
jgi:2'-5' RNA ligase